MLRVIAGLVQRLHRAQVAYCHWKSNEHLDAALQGLTDLDVLVAGRDGAAVALALAEAGFKRFPAAPAASYPGIADYLGFDTDTGRLVHLHLHYQLTLGEKLLKGYRIPWEGTLLQTRRLDPSGVYVADPHLEMLLLIVRTALKLRTRDRRWGGSRRPAVQGGQLREWLWLAERVQRDRLIAVAEPLVGLDAARALSSLAARVPTRGEVVAFQHAVRPRLASYRIYGPLEARRRRWSREWARRWRAWRRVTPGQAPTRRTLPHGGRIIALLGCDGSGKSTIVREVASWLGWKIDVVPIYFGSGDGPASGLRRPLRLLRVLRRRAGPLRPGGSSTPPGAPPRSWRKQLLRAWWALAVAREKRDRLALARRARDLGMVVVCDRYPQTQIMGFTDGPLLGYWRDARSSLFRWAARWEHGTYQAAASFPPDLVVKLHVSEAVALGRKPDMAPEPLPRRIDAIRRLAFPTTVVDVDADQPLPEVLRQVKQAVWRAM